MALEQRYDQADPPGRLTGSGLSPRRNGRTRANATPADPAEVSKEAVTASLTGSVSTSLLGRSAVRLSPSTIRWRDPIPPHLDALDTPPMPSRILRDQANRPKSGLRVRPELMEKSCSTRSGTVNQHRYRRISRATAAASLEDHLLDTTRADCRHPGDQERYDRHGPRDLVERVMI